ncbi:glycosyltransferase family 2 protein [Psychrobacillus sp. FSL W7-1493]|uniref:glycosyltransferase n=1 Tax=Psychrobacillus sp. FSL W7-1493 TaxID=2921552 RepID=UPI0030FC8D42
MDLLSIGLIIIFILYLLLQLKYIYSSLNTTKTKLLILPEKKISVLIPAYNEELVLKQCLDSWFRLDYTNKEAIFINDGSTDATLHVLQEMLDLEVTPRDSTVPLNPRGIKNVYLSKKYPDILVVDQYNGGKSAALNTGISIATGEIVITLDADSILEKNSLNKINEAFVDSKVIAGGGMVHVGQQINKQGLIHYTKNWIIKYQVSGYLSSFYVRKVTQAKLNVLNVVSGAFGAFRRDVLQQIGGYRDTLGEDMEITFRLQKYMHNRNLGEKMIFIPEAVCYTEVPENFASLMHQRIRWQKGFIDCINLYKKDFFINLGKKFSSFLLFESITLSIVGTVALVIFPISIILGNVSGITFLLMAIAWFSEFILRLVAVQRAGYYGYKFSILHWLRIILFTMWESITYRFLDTFFFTYGTILYFFGSRTNWNKLTRSGAVHFEDIEPAKVIAQ